MFYPNAAFLSSASQICIGAGKQVEVNFFLHSRASFWAKAKLEFPSGFTRDFEPISGLRNEYGQLVPSWTNDYDHKSTILRFGPFRPGFYEIDTATGINETDLVARRKIQGRRQ